MYYDSADTANFRFTDNTYACMFDGNVGSWFSLKLQVPMAATYRAVSFSSYWNYGSIMKIYLAPENAENPRASEYEIGIIDSYKNPAVWNEKIPLQIVKLEKANYILTYEMIGQNFNSSGMRFPVHGFLLTPPDATELYVRCDAVAPIAQGESSTVPLYAKINGATSSFADATELVAESSDTEVCDVQVVRENERASLVLTGKKAGNSTIVVKATIRGISSDTTVPVRVAREDELRTVKIGMDQTVLKVGESANAKADLRLMNGKTPAADTTKIYFESSDEKVVSVEDVYKRQGL